MQRLTLAPKKEKCAQIFPQLALRLTPRVPISGKVHEAPIGSISPLLSKAMAAVQPTQPSS